MHGLGANSDFVSVEGRVNEDGVVYSRFMGGGPGHLASEAERQVLLRVGVETVQKEGRKENSGITHPPPATTHWRS